ncbi:unnamed protein product [Hermetia illucens]|uniref:G-protein coupled receptors family 1 profile domain-containing protein n=1 Tax=Hermetia illucens TaxID=343691 RepID=A0A7R8V7T2_HERIL|nr:unnamed protein product [Hermetia illucens]
MNVEPSNELTTQHTNKMNQTTIEPSTSRNAGTELSKPKVIIQTGLERYMTIVEKRKRSPQGSPTTDRAAKIVNDNENLSNYYSVLDQDTEQYVDMTNSQNEQATRQDPPRPKHKPPPIYIREPNSSKLVAELKSLIGKNNFYLVDLKRGKIRETKVQVSDEVKYCQVVSWLDGKGSHYYTYQLKSAKGLRVIIKGIDSDVDPNDIISDLKTKGFDVKTAHNVLNKSKIPQPMFKIELTAESSKIPKGRIHPIYHVKYYNGKQRRVCFMMWPDGRYPTSKSDYIYNIIILILTYGVPMLVMLVCYSLMGRVLWGSKSIGENTERQIESMKSKKKVVRMFIVIVSIFAICWLPYHMFFIYAYHNNKVTSAKYVQHMYLGFYWLAMSNAMVNPIIYYWMNRR